MSQGLSFFNTLVDLLTIRSHSLLELVEVLLLLVECGLIQVAVGSPCRANWLTILLITVSILVLAGYHLSTGLTSSVLLRGKSWIESFIFIVYWVQRVKNARVSTSL